MYDIIPIVKHLNIKYRAYTIMIQIYFSVKDNIEKQDGYHHTLKNLYKNKPSKPNDSKTTGKTKRGLKNENCTR